MFIQLHGGRMWAESAGMPGQGTAVSFSLPLPSANVASDLPPTQHDAEFWQSRYDQARSERAVLVAADDQSVLRVATRLLNNQGRVVTSSLGGIAQMLPQHQPDVVMAFTGGEGQSHPAVLDLLNLPAEMPMVTCVLENNLAVQDRETLETQDVNTWLLKPITRDDLVAAVLTVAPNARVVMSVEDDAAMARFYELSLASDKRFAVTPVVINVTHVAEVMPILQEHVPDAILLDLNLADGSGWDVLAQIRARWSRDRLPVVVVTAMDRYGLPVLRARELTVRRADGLSQRQTVLCLQNLLEAVLS